MYRNRRIAVVIPAYNEELLIDETLAYIPNYVDKIYVIDDASTDETLEILKMRAKTNPKLSIIRHEFNKGVGAAIISGYKMALIDEMEIAAVMAGDNQMDPAYLPDFLDPIIDGAADYTKGNRLVTPGFSKGMSKWRHIGNYILTFLTKISSGYWQVIDPQNGYTAISARALRSLELDSIYPRYGYCNNILTKMNVHSFKIMNISHPARYGSEKSKIKYGSYIVRVSRLLFDDFLWRIKTKYVLTNFHPLVLFYLSGSVLSIMGVLSGAYSILYGLRYSAPIFEKGILSLITMAFGIQLILFAMVFDMIHGRQNIEEGIVSYPISRNISSQALFVDREMSGSSSIVSHSIENPISTQSQIDSIPVISK